MLTQYVNVWRVKRSLCASESVNIYFFAMNNEITKIMQHVKVNCEHDQKHVEYKNYSRTYILATNLAV